MSANTFVDTNILVYAHDRDAGEKHNVGRQLVIELWQASEWPSLSVQVLQELYVNLLKKGVTMAEARATVQDYAAWNVVENTVALLENGIGEMERWGLSFWDSLVLAAARHTAATLIYSEDLSSEQDYGGIRVVNPFGR